jgi:hypothetical protein
MIDLIPDVLTTGCSSAPLILALTVALQIVWVPADIRADRAQPLRPIFGGNPKGAVLSNRRLARTLTAYIVFLNVGCAAHGQRVVDQGMVIEDVTLISPERAAPLRHADVDLRDGRVAEIGTNLVPGPHARRIDGGGRFLIPGLIDSHVHTGQSAALDDDAIEAHPELWAAYRAQNDSIETIFLDGEPIVREALRAHN